MSASCVMRAPPLWRSIAVNTEKLSLAEAKERLQDLTEGRIEDSPFPNSLLLKANYTDPRHLPGPSQSRAQVYLEARCATRVLRGDAPLLLGIVGFSKPFEPDSEIDVFADALSYLPPGGVRQEKLRRHRTVHIGTARSLISSSDLNRDEYKLSSVDLARPTMEFLPGTRSFDWGSAQILNFGIGDFASVDTPVKSLQASLLQVGEGDRVLDISNVGPSALHVAAQLPSSSQATVVGLSPGPMRHHAAHYRAARFAHPRLTTVTASAASEVLSSTSSLPRGIGGLPFARESFDRILFQPDCGESGFRASFKAHITDGIALRRLQWEGLRTCAELLKPCGRLVYAVESLLPEEGINHIRSLLEMAPRLHLASAPINWSVPRSEALWSSYFGQDSLTESAPEGSVQLLDPRLLCAQHEEGECRLGLVKRTKALWKASYLLQESQPHSDYDGTFIAVLEKE